MGFSMFESILIGGMAAYVLNEVKLPPCIIGEPIKDSGYCVSRQYADIKMDFIAFSKKLNTNPQDLRIIIDLKNYGSFSMPYRKDGVILEYRVNFD
jgi:hypothetical protein